MKKMTLVIFVLLAVCMFCGCSKDKGSDKKQNSEIQRKLYAVDVLIPDEADNNLHKLKNYLLENHFNCNFSQECKFAQKKPISL